MITNNDNLPEIINRGLKRSLIRINNEGTTITYINQNKVRAWGKERSEEFVQAEAFLSLILDYGYDLNRVRLYVPVKMGSDIKEADILVYNDDECTQPHI